MIAYVECAACSSKQMSKKQCAKATKGQQLAGGAPHWS